MPAMTATAPPAMSHIDLSVGLPVKNLETSELNDWDSLNPNIRRTMPNAKTAKPMMFMG